MRNTLLSKVVSENIIPSFQAEQDMTYRTPEKSVAAPSFGSSSTDTLMPNMRTADRASAHFARIRSALKEVLDLGPYSSLSALPESA